MQNDRIAALQKMVERSPDDARARFGLAMELEKQARWEEAAAQLTRYLELADDEGNAWGRLGNALRQLGRDEEARAAYTRGIAIANQHGHPSMAAEFEETLDDW
ncbi:MAG TPA: tetratricopeptide repeat protein [Longimicrobiales bacterium]|nr:tetratricopeptide repeat protein [Longimicrobiales bacterium]